jgi:GNAT superfamily N-acetyltransferase
MRRTHAADMIDAHQTRAIPAPVARDLADKAVMSMLVWGESIRRATGAGEVITELGINAFLRDIDLSTANSVILGVPMGTVTAEAVSRVLGTVATRKLPCTILVRPQAATDDVIEALASAGKTAIGISRLMVWLDPQPAETDVAVRRLAAHEVRIHADVAGEVFGIPTEFRLALHDTRVAALPDLRMYVSEVDGRPVATGSGIQTGPMVAVVALATKEPYRRRGLAQGITHRIVADAMAAGARWACLLASEAGYPLYEKIGFRTIERWAVWR